MRLTVNECTVCHAAFLGRKGQASEHCSKPATFRHDAIDRCEAEHSVVVGTPRQWHKLIAEWTPTLPTFKPQSEREGRRALARIEIGRFDGLMAPNARPPKSLPRDWWQHGGQDVNERAAQDPGRDFVVHVHRCIEKEGHDGEHRCTCDYEWAVAAPAGGAVGWSALDAATQLTCISATEQFFDDEPEPDGNQMVDGEVDINFVGTPTDDMDVALYGSLDGGTDDDDTPFAGFTVDNGTDPNQVKLPKLFADYHTTIGVAASGATDTHTSADMNHRLMTMS